jgi:hypothetical protein
MSERGGLNAHDLAHFARTRAENKARYYDALASLHATGGIMTGVAAAVAGFMFAEPLNSYQAVQELGVGPGVAAALIAGILAAASVGKFIEAGTAMKDASDMRSV